MKRIPAALLLLSMLLSLAACGDSEAQKENTSAADTTVQTEVPAETELKDNVPVLDFGGDSMTFATMEMYKYEMDVEESTGEITNDAVYNRNLLMEDRFNVVNDMVVQPERDEQTAVLRSSILANDNAFDVGTHFVYLAGNLVLENLFLDWMEIPHVELHQPWWVTEINNAFTINNRLYSPVSDLCITHMQLSYIYLFNHQLAQDYNTEDLYTVVDEGRWTLDYMYDLTTSVYQDTDGNGKANNQDVYGLVTDKITSIDCCFPASEQPTLQETDTGLEVVVGTERAVNIYEKVYKLFYENTGTFVIPDYESKHAMFLNNQALLMPIRLVKLFSEMREMEVDYGILPFPKYDEAQQKYYNSCLDNYSVLLVPNNVENREMVGALVEAMSFESMKSVMPAFYESALQGKYTRDEQSVRMLDLIMDSHTFDVSILYGSFFTTGTLSYILRNTISSKKPYVSNYETYKDAYSEQAQKLYESLKALGE